MLIGGVAVILRGVARVTDDVDATVWAEQLDVDHVLAILSRHDIVPRIPDAADFARERQVLLLRHELSGTDGAEPGLATLREISVGTGGADRSR
jgi:hypothetical protein